VTLWRKNAQKTATASRNSMWAPITPLRPGD
jgi:hypothetical protein